MSLRTKIRKHVKFISVLALNTVLKGPPCLNKDDFDFDQIIVVLCLSMLTGSIPLQANKAAYDFRAMYTTFLVETMTKHIRYSRSISGYSF